MKKSTTLLLAFLGTAALVQTGMSTETQEKKKEELTIILPEKPKGSYLAKMKNIGKKSEERILTCLKETGTEIEKNSCLLVNKLETALEETCRQAEGIGQQAEDQCKIAQEMSSNFAKKMMARIEKYSEEVSKLSDEYKKSLTDVTKTFETTLFNKLGDVEKNIGLGLIGARSEFETLAENALEKLEAGTILLSQGGDSVVNQVKEMFLVEEELEKGGKSPGELREKRKSLQQVNKEKHFEMATKLSEGVDLKSKDITPLIDPAESVIKNMQDFLEVLPQEGKTYKEASNFVKLFKTFVNMVGYEKSNADKLLKWDSQTWSSLCSGLKKMLVSVLLDTVNTCREMQQKLQGSENQETMHSSVNEMENAVYKLNNEKVMKNVGGLTANLSKAAEYLPILEKYTKEFHVAFQSFMTAYNEDQVLQKD